MPEEETPTDCDDALPPPNNADTQEEQLAALTEPVFDHHSRYETPRSPIGRGTQATRAQ